MHAEEERGNQLKESVFLGPGRRTSTVCSSTFGFLSAQTMKWKTAPKKRQNLALTMSPRFEQF
jgi:hypothetical protein